MSATPGNPPRNVPRPNDPVDVRMTAATAQALLGALTSRTLPSQAVISEVQAAIARVLGYTGGGKKGKAKAGSTA